MTNYVHLLIATTGSYEQHRAWIVQIFTDKAEATTEATRLNAEKEHRESLCEEYDILSRELRSKLAESYLAAEGRSVMPAHRFFHLSQAKRSQVISEVERELGPEPEYPEADNYTVMSIPFGESGEWELP